jgi:hypothetical protein
MILRRYTPQQVQWILWGGALVLLLVYFGLFRPLAQSAEALDKPLQALGKKLEAAGNLPAAGGEFDLAGVSRALQEVERARERLLAQRETALARVRPVPEVEARLSDPFRLIDFYHERQLRLDKLREQARRTRTELGAGVLGAMPDYRLEVTDAVLLWAQLSLAEQLLSMAMECGVGRISRLQVRPRMEAAVAGQMLDEIAVELELGGSMRAVSKFLAGLPLLEEERVEAGLPAGLAGPGLFIDRLFLRKGAVEKPDDVQLQLVVTGLVMRDGGRAGRTGW